MEIRTERNDLQIGSVLRSFYYKVILKWMQNEVQMKRNAFPGINKLSEQEHMLF